MERAIFSLECYFERVKISLLQLELLWQDAPEYGDPAKIGRKVGILDKSKFKAFYLGTFSRMGSTNSVKLTIDRIDDSGAVIATWVWDPGGIARCQGTIDNDTISLICQQGEHYSFTYTGFLQPDGSLKGEVVYTKNSTAKYEGTLSPG